MTSMNSAPLSRSAIIKYHQQWSTSFIIKHHETFSTIIINHHLSAIKCHCFWRIYQWFTIKLPPVTKITTDQWLFLVPLKGGIGSIVHPPIGSIYIYIYHLYTFEGNQKQPLNWDFTIQIQGQRPGSGFGELGGPRCLVDTDFDRGYCSA